MSRMMLVALREFIENVRTKGFWIGIMMMPIVLVMVALVPVLVESTRVAKTYGVIDLSAGTLKTVDQIIERTDFRFLLTDISDGKEAELPANFASIYPEIRSLSSENQSNVISFIFDDGALNPELSRRLQKHLADHRVEIREWWRSISDEEKAELSNRVSQNFYRRVEGNPGIDQLNELLEADEIFAYFVIGDNPQQSSDGSRYFSNNLTDRDLQNWFGNLVSEHIRGLRLAESEIDEDLANWINEPIEFEGSQVGADGATEEVDTTDVARQWAPVVFVYFLWISVLINTQMLITNTIEEKSNKLIEVLLSSVSPITLMGGKIIGIAATGLTIVASWLLMAMAFFIGLPAIAGVELPIDLSSVIGDPWFLTSFLMYFILGYLFYAALLVGLGALCNNLKEAQNLIMPVQMVQMLPILLMVPIGRDPNGVLAQVLSYVPPLTPFVMMNRAAGPPSNFEYIVTTILLVVSTIVAFWLAAKLFRIGILMTGKAPSPMQIIKLLRAPVTTVR